MRRFNPVGNWLLVLLALCLFVAPSSAFAVTVWSGLATGFSKAADTEWSLPQNQDRITSSVFITRALGSGIFNAESESFYTTSGGGLPNVSPAGTEWAWDLMGNNSGLQIAATNWAALVFNPWKTAHSGAVAGPPGSGGGPSATVGIPGVLHVISEDIYIDIKFTSWGQGSGAGGAFSYERAIDPVPEPNTALLISGGLICLGLIRNQHRA
jgi:hypothetical protein